MVAMWAVINEYTPPLAPASRTVGSQIDVPSDPAKTPAK